MLLSVFSIPSPPPIGTTVGSMTAILNRAAPAASATQVSMMIASAVQVKAPDSSATRTGYKSTATLVLGAVTTTHS